MALRKRPIKNHEGYYIGEDGSVWSSKKRVSLGRGFGSKIVIGNLKRRLVVEGPSKYLKYQSIVLKNNQGLSKHHLVHVLVATAFIGPKPSKKHEIRHLDGNRLNNWFWNLAWGTRKENRDDSKRHGTLVMGEKHPAAKLSSEKVRWARIQKSRGASVKEMAKILKVHKDVLGSAIAGRSWKHVI